MRNSRKFLFLIFSIGFLISSCEKDEPFPTYTLSTHASPAEGGKINVSPQSTTYKEGDIVTLTPEASQNWVFQRWEGDAIGNIVPLSVIMDFNRSVVGVFVKKDYPLNITIEGEGTVNEVIITNPSGREYPYGTVVEMTPVPKSGWVFESWGGDLSGTENPKRITVDQEKNVRVKFIENPKFFLHENGLTCMCPSTKPGEKGIINGVVYESVDNDLIRKRVGKNFNLSKLCTSLVTDMSDLFMYSKVFIEPIVNWDVSNVTDMAGMFFDSPFFNQPIGDWDVSNVTNMSGMFYKAIAFNQPIGDWDVSKVKYMSWMFRKSDRFNQPIENWNVSNVTEMGGMFSYSPFNQPIENWNVSKVTNMREMFFASSFNHPIGNWNVSNVTDMSGMFFYSSFNQPIGNWDVSNVTDMNLMFYNTPFDQPIENWDVSNVEDMSEMFYRSRFNQPIGNWNVSKVKDVEGMFGGCKFNHPIGDWDVRNVTDMSSMFYNSYFNQPIGDWDVRNVTEMQWMFRDSKFNQNISKWCVFRIPSEPYDFSTNCPLIQENKPKWGTCPE